MTFCIHALTLQVKPIKVYVVLNEFFYIIYLYYHLQNDFRIRNLTLKVRPVKIYVTFNEILYIIYFIIKNLIYINNNKFICYVR